MRCAPFIRQHVVGWQTVALCPTSDNGADASFRTDGNGYPDAPTPRWIASEKKLPVRQCLLCVPVQFRGGLRSTAWPFSQSVKAKDLRCASCAGRALCGLCNDSPVCRLLRL